MTTTEQQDRPFNREELTALTRIIVLINDDGVFVKLCVGYSNGLNIDASDMVRAAIGDINGACSVDIEGGVIEAQHAYLAVHSLELLHTVDSDLLPLPNGLLTKCHELYAAEVDRIVAENVDRLLKGRP